jgi:hypothetical protein
MSIAVLVLVAVPTIGVAAGALVATVYFGRLRPGYDVAAIYAARAAERAAERAAGGEADQVAVLFAEAVQES